MRKRCKQGAWIFLLGIAFSLPVHAAEFNPLNFNVVYNFTWIGIPFGQIHITSHTEDGRFAMSSAIRSTFIAALFSRHRSHASAAGAVTDDITKSSRVFETAYDNNDEPNRIRLVFENGRLKERMIEDPDPPGKRPPIPDEALADTTDLLTFVPAVRERLRASLENHARTFEVKLFDGRRLMNTVWRIQGFAHIDYDGRDTHVIVCTARRIPLGGYTQKELKRMKNDPQFTAYFSDDGRLMPLVLTLDTWIGQVKAVLSGSG